MLATYAVCVFPANVKHAIDGLAYGRNHLGLGYHLPRLLFQPVILWWTLFAGGAIGRPLGKPRQAGVAPVQCIRLSCRQ